MEALIMPIRKAEITKPMSQWDISPPLETYPLINHQGANFQMVPLAIIEKLKSDRENLMWLSIGLGAMTAAALVALVAGAFKPATQVITVEKPVIVTQEKIVSTNCLIFCK